MNQQQIQNLLSTTEQLLSEAKQEFVQKIDTITNNFQQEARAILQSKFRDDENTASLAEQKTNENLLSKLNSLK